MSNVGRQVTDEHYEACLCAGASSCKRTFFNNMFDDNPAVIASEESLKLPAARKAAGEHALEVRLGEE